MFGIMDLCESAFYNMSFIKSCHRSSRRDDSLLNLLRLATMEIQVEIQSLLAVSERHQCSQ
jgi:hypothetical protein